MILFLKLCKFFFLIMASLVQVVLMFLMGVTPPQICLLGITLICLSLTSERIFNIIAVVRKIN
ncbi:hypothetical protein [Butyrivibrio sp. MC2021]|uniref:hypothetical protein n=1 Tax=Butyrivibrio sp. MC2021 TaxID=1408306 RepID=UPI00047E1B0E|nr:hypothetical protein [Butyrivibrio sp. MC2021]